MKLGVQVGLGPCHIVLDGDPGPLPQRATAPPPNFRPMDISCGQMTQCIKMPVGRKVGVDPSDTALDGDPASPTPKREQSPQFSAHVYCAKTAGWIKMSPGTEVGLDPSDIVLDGDPAPPPQKGGRAPNFPHMSVVAKLLHGSR